MTGILLVAALAWLYYDSVLAVPFLLPLLIVWHREWEQSRMEKEKEQFRMQFREWDPFAVIFSDSGIFR